jgi:uncharacterized membrane protein YfhO
MSTHQEKRDKAAAKLAGLRSELDALEKTRTKEDLHGLIDSWIAAASTQVADLVRGYVLNGHANAEQRTAVLEALALKNPETVNSLRAEIEPLAELSDKQKTSKKKALDEAISKAEQEHFAATKALRLSELEQEFSQLSGEAA